MPTQVLVLDHVRRCALGNGVFGFHQGSSEGGRRFVCYIDVVALEVSGFCLGDTIDVGEVRCPD